MKIETKVIWEESDIVPGLKAKMKSDHSITVMVGELANIHLRCPDLALVSLVTGDISHVTNQKYKLAIFLNSQEYIPIDMD